MVKKFVFLVGGVDYVGFEHEWSVKCVPTLYVVY